MDPLQPIEGVRVRPMRRVASSSEMIPSRWAARVLQRYARCLSASSWERLSSDRLAGDEGCPPGARHHRPWRPVTSRYSSRRRAGLRDRGPSIRRLPRLVPISPRPVRAGPMRRPLGAASLSRSKDFTPPRRRRRPVFGSGDRPRTSKGRGRPGQTTRSVPWQLRRHPDRFRRRRRGLLGPSGSGGEGTRFGRRTQIVARLSDSRRTSRFLPEITPFRTWPCRNASPRLTPSPIDVSAAIPPRSASCRSRGTPGGCRMWRPR